MINRLRTLLLNVPGPGSPAYLAAAYPGEEYVDPAYAAVAPPALPAAVARALDLVFGPAPDRAMRNARVNQLMACVYQGPLRGRADALDPRTTFWADGGPAFGSSVFAARQAGPVVTPVALPGGPTPPPGVSVTAGAGLAVLATGTLYHAWTVTAGPGAGQVTVARLTAPTSAATVTPASAGGLLGPVALPGPLGVLAFVAASAAAGSAWSVTLTAGPAYTLDAALAACAAGGDAFTAAAFVDGRGGVDPAASVWTDPLSPAWAKAAAVAVGLGGRVDAARRGG